MNITKELSPLLRGKVYTDLATRLLYATDASIFKLTPLAVIEPKDFVDIKETLKFAHKYSLPVAARGAGTGLAGESLTQGLVLDLSVHFNRIKQIDCNLDIVTLEAGVTLGQLNLTLKDLGKIFGPDPATANRCTLGGMINNNSTGAHSLRYGMTRDWLHSLTVMLADGNIVRLGRNDLQQTYNHSAEAKLYKDLIPLLQQNEKLIEHTWPATPRNRHGYLLKDVISNNTIDLCKLIAGSEGTLAIVLEAKLKITDLPKATDLIYLNFATLEDAARAVPKLLKFSPCAIEIIDETCLNMARTNPLYQQLFPQHIKSILLVEFDGENLEEIGTKIKRLESSFEIRHCQDQAEKENIWQMRKLISGMINKFPGDYQPIPLIEDVCVSPDHLVEYLSGVKKILQKRDLNFLCFGHAGDGTVHLRPFLNTRQLSQSDWLPPLCDEVYQLTLDLKGSISGEHGDGFLRAPFIAKQYKELFPIFKQIKNIFDPYHLLNPNKKTGCTDFRYWKNNLRYQQPQRQFENKFSWAKKKLEEVVGACNGCGACRSRLRDTDMCPIFRIYGLEMATPRAKANLVRAFLNGEVPFSTLKQLSDYCLNCKMCALECPSNVQAADLILEIRARASKGLQTRLLLQLENLLKLGSLTPKLTNFFSNQSFTKWIVERLVGITRWRDNPKLAKLTAIQEHAKLYHLPARPGDHLKVVYFLDTFTNLINTNVARALIRVLQHNNIEVIIPKQKESGVVQMTYGNLKRIKKIAAYNLEQLLPYVRQGYKVICTEPSAALMLKEEYLQLSNNADFQELSQATYDYADFLLMLDRQGQLKKNFHPLNEQFRYHFPCHLKILQKTPMAIKLLQLIPELKTDYANYGCCGIAGTYGMKKKNYQNSQEIGKNLFNALSNSKVVTDCSTCKLQIEHNVKTHELLHPIELLAKAYNYSAN